MNSSPTNSIFGGIDIRIFKTLMETKLLIFQNGKFVPDDHLDFSSKEPYSLRDPRGMHMIRNNYPGPGEYKIESFAEKIIKEGKKKN